ncbi:ATP-grasp fold amidoligase family protein, partial [Vibrio kanaloae]|uniref:ATP-grasp fold amidoligase family protein n=1 Tax=Vibrio kanaloae TaxID=170673 RepID=UPI001EFC87A6
IVEIMLKFVSIKNCIKLMYLTRHHRIPNIEKARLFTEKIQERKLSPKKIYSDLSDKYLVRDYVSKIINERSLVSLLGVYNSFDEINMDLLPEKFVIKTNFGSGSEHIEIVKSKSQVNMDLVRDKFVKAIAEPYKGAVFGEMHYSKIEKKIIIEQFIETENGDLPDYKFHCFNGRVGFVQLDFDRFSAHKRNIYNRNFEKLDCKLGFPNGDYELAQEDKLKGAIAIAENLSSDFDYVRVDLYIVRDVIYFGEFTFTPDSGFAKFSPAKFDREFGALWRNN